MVLFCGVVMPLTSYRVYLGVTIDVTFSDEDRAELALVHLLHRIRISKRSDFSQYQAMVAIDQLSAYIATAFQVAHNERQLSIEHGQTVELQGIGVFAVDEQEKYWCCYREDFGSIFVQVRSPLSVLGIGST